MTHSWTRLWVDAPQERYNLLGGDFPFIGGSGADPLTEQRAITGLLGEAARDALRMDVESAARAPWLLSFSIGADGGREVYAAEMQARWAGAIWLRGDVQTQLAVYLLRGGADTSGEYASGVALWALGRGQQIPQIVDLAEPHFDSGSADFVIANLMRTGALTGRFDPRLIETGIECWDLISESTAITLLDRVEPVATDHPVFRRNAILFSLLALRAPEGWMERLDQLTGDQLRAVVSGMSPAVAERVALPAVKRLYEAVLSAETIEADALPTVATLMGRLSDVEEFEPADQVPARVVVRLAWGENEMLDESELSRVIGELTQDVEREVDEARSGSASMGTETPTNTLASAVIKLGEIPQGILDLMLLIVDDPSLPRNMRYDAIKFLAAVTHAGLFDPSSRADLQIDAIGAAFAERLRELFGRGDREVRAAIARLVTEADLPQDLRELGQELARRAAADRSYEVRMAAAKEPSGPEPG